LPQPDHGSGRSADRPRGLMPKACTDLGGQQRGSELRGTKRSISQIRHANLAFVVPLPHAWRSHHIPSLVPLADSCQDLGHDCNARLRASGHSDASAGAHLPRTSMPRMQPHGDSRQPSRQSCFTLMVCNPLDHSWRGHRIFPPPLCAVVMMQVRLQCPPESFGTFRRLGGLPSQATGRPPNWPALPPGASSLQLAPCLWPRQLT